MMIGSGVLGTGLRRRRKRKDGLIRFLGMNIMSVVELGLVN